MRIGIIGSGVVGQQLGLGFLQSGNEVKIGTRDAGKLTDWLRNGGKGASAGSNSEAAAFGELVVLATKWEGTESAISMAGKHNFKDKIVIDVTNPLVFDQAGQPPKLDVAFPGSGGMVVQGWLPEAKVVKAFNIITAYYMANPEMDEGLPDMFIAGNDATAKAQVMNIASEWGWPVTDLGGIEQAYLMESLAMLWIRYGFLNNHWTHAFKLLKK